MELTFKNHVGNQTALGFGLRDRRNDNEDCVVKSGANSLLIFTKTNFLFVSCVAEPNPCTVFFPIRSLNVIPSDISKYANLVGALLARTFFLLGIDMWKSQFQHLGWRSPFAACCKIYVVYVRLSFTTCINKC